MKIYQVIHEYDVDGGFGDAVGKEEVVITFSTEEKANEFVEKYANPHVYKMPYDRLECGFLKVQPVEIDGNPDDIDMWWLEGDKENEEHV